MVGKLVFLLPFGPRGGVPIERLQGVPAGIEDACNRKTRQLSRDEKWHAGAVVVFLLDCIMFFLQCCPVEKLMGGRHE